MLRKLVLKNFKAHEALEINFTEGLNVLRGANEAGKSTIFEAILYACYGARGLVEPLDLTVTWGKEVKTLEVLLELDFAGQTYSIRRSKTGASLTFGTTLVSGQSEVTGFIENLFGVPLSVAIQIQFATQSQLKNVVDAGAATVTLIESISGLDEIDTIIDKMQTQLPCGTTANLESQIASLSELREPVADHAALEHVIHTIEEELKLSATELKVLRDKQALIPKANYEAIIKAYDAEEVAITNLRKRIADFACRGAPTRPEGPTIAEIDSLEAVHANMQRLSTAHHLYERLPSRSIDTTRELVAKQIAKAKELIRETDASIRTYELSIATSRALLIKDKECTLCGKDLTDVPEVVAKNLETTKRIEDCEAKLSEAKLWLIAQTTALDRIEQQQKDLAAAFKLRDESEYISITEAEEHTLVSFTGDIDALESYDFANRDFFGGFVKLRKAWQTYELETAGYTALSAEMEKDYTTVRNLTTTRTDKTEAVQGLADWNMYTPAIAMCENLRVAITARLNDATTKLTVAKALHEEAVKTYARDSERLASVKSELAIVHYHNALLKKLRDARPIVGAQLWTLVLSAVSDMFSSIRGEPSIVTRTADGFLVNGRPVKGLSGSTKDSLGLALRYGLQRTFLPLVDFTLVDEPASGCDDTREEAMIGQLSSCGYRQVVLVTHSDLADAFAANLIRI